jgi:hypothetical protein
LFGICLAESPFIQPSQRTDDPLNKQPPHQPHARRSRVSSSKLALLALFIPHLACSGTEAGPSASGGVGGSGGGAAMTGSLYEGFTVELVAATASTVAFTRFGGNLYAGPYPPAIPLTLDSREGDCALWVPTRASCAPTCQAGVCTSNDVCTPYPSAMSGGTLLVRGLGPDLSIEPVTARFTYQAPSALPYPACVEGAVVSVTAAGFGVESACVAPLVATTPTPVPVAKGSAVMLAWEPAGEAGSSRIHILLDIAHHGGKTGEIQCDVADTGSYSIPEILVTKLVDLGLAGFPTVELSRRTRGTSLQEPNVSLTVAATVVLPVATGVTSCSSNDDCPGSTCLDSLMCGS